MGLPNVVVTRVMSRKEVFADYINGSVYGGKKVLKPDMLTQISPYLGTLIEKDGSKKKVKEGMGDVWMRAECGTYSVVFANELQNKVHYAMPVRNMLYEALGYASQVEEYEKKHREKQELKDSSSFLSGVTGEDLLTPIITTVMFWGDHWDGPTRLIDMMDLGDEEEAEILKEYLPDFRIRVVNVKEFENPDVFDSCLQHIFSLVKYKKDKGKFFEYLQGHREEMKKMDKYELEALKMMIGGEKQLARIQLNKEEGGDDVCQAIEELIEDGRIEGRLKGRLEGRMQLLIEQVCRKLKKGKDVECIAEELEEEVSVIRDICEVASVFAPEYDGEMVAKAWFEKKK